MRIPVSGEYHDVKENLTVAALIRLENVEMPAYGSAASNEGFAKWKNVSTLWKGDCYGTA